MHKAVEVCLMWTVAVPKCAAPLLAPKVDPNVKMFTAWYTKVILVSIANVPVYDNCN